jgi:crossover junction endodeoxyribonuclease RuvC
MSLLKKKTEIQIGIERILGIDPGYGRVGAAVVEKRKKEKEILIFSECIITTPQISHHERLRALGERVAYIIDTYKPTILSIEKLYFNENQKTAFAVSEARGVILFIASQKGLQIEEFTPLQIKTAITGYGRADKKQMKDMLTQLIKIRHEIIHDDEHDAIAAALTSIATQTRQ